MDVPIEEHGRVQFVIAASALTGVRGAVSRVVSRRRHRLLPLGQMPLIYEARRADVFRITNVTPPSIRGRRG
jgi:hypothetical protein